MLPADTRFEKDAELKENNSPPSSVGRRSASRHSRLLSEVVPLDNLPQSPENDVRSCEDYDPPWDVKGKRPLGSVSVPERLSLASHPLPTSITHDKLEAVEEGKDNAAANKLNRPTGEKKNDSQNKFFFICNLRINL